MQTERMISLGTFIEHTDEYLGQLHTHHSPLFLIQNDAPVAVIQDINEYQKLLDALYMLKLIAPGEKEIQEGKGRLQAEVFADIHHRLESRNG